MKHFCKYELSGFYFALCSPPNSDQLCIMSILIGPKGVHYRILLYTITSYKYVKETFELETVLVLEFE